MCVLPSFIYGVCSVRKWGVRAERPRPKMVVQIANQNFFPRRALSPFAIPKGGFTQRPEMNFEMYRGTNKHFYVFLSRTQAGPGRTVKASAGRNFSQPRTNLYLPRCTLSWPSLFICDEVTGQREFHVNTNREIEFEIRIRLQSFRRLGSQTYKMRGEERRGEEQDEAGWRPV